MGDSGPGDEASQSTRVLGLIGLGLRARSVVVGVEQVRQAAKAGTLQVAFVGHDAAAHSKAKVEPLLAARGVRVLHGWSAAALGAVAGRDVVAALGVVDPALARGIFGIVDGVQAQRHGVANASRGRGGRGSTGRAG
jgi:ribosomal protein L7Ae-like RNA K-turn-binding protein